MVSDVYRGKVVFFLARSYFSSIFHVKILDNRKIRRDILEKFFP